MKGLSSKIYDKDYYLNSNLGFEEFKKYKGKKTHKKTHDFADLLGDVEGKKILDLGCGRGDLVFELARRGGQPVGIDYSKDGVDIANFALKGQPKAVQENVNFFVMDAKKLKFEDNSFDFVVSYDVFEHLYKDELEIVLNQIKKVLKPQGLLVVHTEANKIYLDFTHKIWCYWVDRFLLLVNRLFFKKTYPGLMKDPRNDLHKAQHVNEPTYFYLRSLFSRNKFTGEINSLVPYKENLSWKDKIYNILVYLYPVSSYLPFNLLFATEYICLQKNQK